MPSETRPEIKGAASQRFSWTSGSLGLGNWVRMAKCLPWLAMVRLLEEPGASAIQADADGKTSNRLDDSGLGYVGLGQERLGLDIDLDRVVAVDRDRPAAVGGVLVGLEEDLEGAQGVFALAFLSAAAAEQRQAQGRRQEQITIEPMPMIHHSAPNNRKRLAK